MKFSITHLIFTLISKSVLSSLITLPVDSDIENSMDKNGKFRILLNSGNNYNQSDSFSNIYQVIFYLLFNYFHHPGL